MANCTQTIYRRPESSIPIFYSKVKCQLLPSPWATRTLSGINIGRSILYVCKYNLIMLLLPPRVFAGEYVGYYIIRLLQWHNIFLYSHVAQAGNTQYILVLGMSNVGPKPEVRAQHLTDVWLVYSTGVWPMYYIVLIVVMSLSLMWAARVSI